MLKVFKIIHIALILTTLVAVPVAAFMSGSVLEHILRPLFVFIGLFALFTINLYAAKVWYRRNHPNNAAQPTPQPKA